MKHISHQEEFPNKEHYAIILFETSYIHHEGDERSRTNPGHGYPEHTETLHNFKYLAFDKTEDGKAEWESVIKLKYIADPKRTDVVAFEATGRMNITTTININP
jgi:hypothetical protein